MCNYKNIPSRRANRPLRGVPRIEFVATGIIEKCTEIIENKSCDYAESRLMDLTKTINKVILVIQKNTRHKNTENTVTGMFYM